MSYRLAANRYEQLASELVTGTWDDPKLAELVDDYASAMSRSGQRLQRFAEVLEASSLKGKARGNRERSRKLARHSRSFKDENNSFRSLVARIDALCHARP